jgi:hypothetical protein
MEIFILVINVHNDEYPHEEDDNEIQVFSTMEFAQRALQHKVSKFFLDFEIENESFEPNLSSYQFERHGITYNWEIQVKVIDAYASPHGASFVFDFLSVCGYSGMAQFLAMEAATGIDMKTVILVGAGIAAATFAGYFFLYLPSTPKTPEEAPAIAKWAADHQMELIDVGAGVGMENISGANLWNMWNKTMTNFKFKMHL